MRQCDIIAEDGKNAGIRLVNKKSVNQRAAEENEVIDCSGKLITKSFAIGHHHVYSALARGMPKPARNPTNFREILKYIWWSLDQNLDRESIRYSALATAIEALKAGATFVVDHHASPGFIKGSLDTIAAAFEQAGINHLLCYEVSDRYGKEKAAEGLEECDSWLEKGQGLVGLHASFTVGNETLQRAVKLMQKHNSGIHMHLAEDKYDQEHCLRTYYQQVGQRLNEAGVLDSPKTILVHGLHLDAGERNIIGKKPCWIAENMESNLKNKVGCFSSRGLGENIFLGTDGMHGDMLRSLKAAFFTGQLGDEIDFYTAYHRLRNIHRYLRENDFSGDGENNLVVIDYNSATGVNSENFPMHLIFGINSSHIRDVIAGGKVVVKDRRLQTIDEEAVMKEAKQQASMLWKRMSAH